MKQLTAATLLALLLVVGNVKAEGTELKASSLETIETKLELETWMTNESLWNTKTLTWVEEETDENLLMENWMTNEMVWNLNSTISVNETETELKMENWMTNNNIWNR
jgi:hypothetical protein